MFALVLSRFKYLLSKIGGCSQLETRVNSRTDQEEDLLRNRSSQKKKAERTPNQRALHDTLVQATRRPPRTDDESILTSYPPLAIQAEQERREQELHEEELSLFGSSPSENEEDGKDEDRLV